MIDRMEEYKSISAQHKLITEFLIDLKNLRSGAEEEDVDG